MQPGTRGIDGAIVRTITAGDVAAVVSAHNRRPDASMAAIRAHNAVVVAAMDEQCTPVPIRFGQWLEDDEAVRAALDADAARWGGLLRRFAGCAEFAIRIFDPGLSEEGPVPPPKTGRDYMEALAARVSGPAASQTQAVAPLQDALRGITISEIVEPLRTAHGVASVACLVHRAHFNAYQTAVEKVRTSLPHFRYLSTGPWPPYSFVTE